MSIVDHLFGSVSGFAFCEDATLLRNTHRRDPNMALHRDTSFDNSFNVAGVIIITLTFQNFGVGFVDEAPCIFDRLSW